jgi:hypothetical protein
MLSLIAFAAGVDGFPGGFEWQAEAEALALGGVNHCDLNASIKHQQAGHVDAGADLDADALAGALIGCMKEPFGRRRRKGCVK